MNFSEPLYTDEAAAVRMDTLPTFPTPFVGRHDELAQIAKLLANPDCRLLTVLGPGGTGKTRLALEVAHQAAAQFRDGLAFVNLQPVGSPELIPSAVASALNLQLFPGGDPLEQIFSFLHERQLLLVLDNFEHLVEQAELVSQLLAVAAGLKVLVTTRERLNLVEEWVFDLQGLAVPSDAEDDIGQFEAVQLFVQSAQRLKVGFTLSEADKPAVTRICRLVGGMPLGIELAAAWVRALSCAEIAAEIERSMDILATPARNAPPRHRNMRAALEHSWNLLPAQEQEVFRRLSVFRGGFTRDAAMQVTGASIWQLTALVDKSLLRADATGCYALQELLRQYAEEQLESSGEGDRIRLAHALYFADFLEQRWTPLRTDKQRQIVDEVSAESGNLRAAWATLCALRRIADLHRAARTLWLAYDLRCRFDEMALLFRQGVDALRPIAGTPEVDRTLGLLLAFLSWPHVGLGIPEQGTVFAQEAVDLITPLNDPDTLLYAYYSLQLNADYLTDNARIQGIRQTAVQVAQQSSDRWGYARIVCQFASLLLTEVEQPGVDPAYRQAACAEARRLGEESRAIAEAWGDLWLRASSTGFLLGNACQVLGEYAEAERYFARAVPLIEELGQSWAIGAIHRNLGEVLRSLDRRAEAISHYRDAMRVFCENGEVHELLIILYDYALVLADNGQLEDSLKLLYLVVRHPRALSFVRAETERAIARLEPKVSASALETAAEWAQTAELDAVVDALLAQAGSVDAFSKSEPSDTPLTDREQEILALMSDGMTNREIADKLVLSVGTVKWYSSQILGKLNVQNRVQALARARELNLLS